MISSFFKSPYFMVGGALSWLFLSIGGFFLYTGSSLVYILFSLVFLYLLADGLYRQLSLGYGFLVVFLWLGFWLKLVVHLFLNYPFAEPVGFFDGSAEAWDAVLMVSSVGAVGVILTKMLFFKYAEKHAWTTPEVGYHAPSWYHSARPWLWLGTWGAIIALSIINTAYGVYQLGPIPLMLPWPLTGLAGWVIGFGLPLLVFTLVYWDQSIQRGWVAGFLVVLVESFLFSITLLSRALYLFQTFPYLLVLYTKRLSGNHVNAIVRMIVLGVWMSVFVASLFLVMVLRYGETSSPIVNGGQNMEAAATPSSLPILKEVAATSSLLGISVAEIVRGVSRLAVDRWIGLEGVMAVSAYPIKNMDLFLDALQERRERGRFDLFTKDICQTVVADIDAEKIQYATIPGGIAFMYFTGSLWAVLVGMMCLTCLMLALERGAYLLTHNPYFCAFWSMGAAQTVASFGMGVGQRAIFLVVCFIAMALIWVVQTISPATKRCPG